METSAAPSHDYASWFSRVGAQLLDQLAIAIVAIAAGLIVGAAAGSGAGIATGVGVYLLGMIGYYTFLHGSESGQTLGKKSAGIAVRGEGGGRVSYGQALGRVLIMFVFQFISPLQLLNFLWPLWDKQKQAIHDKAASTIVVKVRH